MSIDHLQTQAIPIGAADALAAVRSRVPGFPDDFESRLDEPLNAVLSHTQLQALILASQALDASIAREPFLDGATGNDLVYWLDRASGGAARAPDGPPPRGSYRTANATLRPVAESDVVPLYFASMKPSAAHRWRFRGGTPSPDAFRRSLFSESVLAQFIVVPIGDIAKGVGLVSAYSADLTAGHCYLAFQRVEDVTLPASSKGLMTEGMFIFIQYLFDHFDFRKLYLEVPEYNRTLFQAGVGSLMVEEGMLKEHHYYGDKWWDQHIYAIYRESWDDVAQHFRGEWEDR